MNTLTALSDIHRKWPAMLAGVFCLALATAVPAEEGDNVCKEDAVKFCKDVKPGGGAIGKCLKEHLSDLSPACEEKVKAKGKEHAKEMKRVCSGDIQRFCMGLKAGGGHILECLKFNEANLSEECKAFVQERTGGD
jgi:hypothetical protein